jgi:hypothetical protein
MGQQETTQHDNDQQELDRTQPSPRQSPRRLDWRPPDYRRDGEEGEIPTPPPVRRVQRPGPRRRPPTEGAPAWVVGLGVGALLAVIGLLVVAFVFSRRAAQPAPTPTVVVVTPTATLAPRPTATTAPLATATLAGSVAEETAPSVSSDTIAVGGYVRVVAPAGLSFRQSPSTNGALIEVLDSGITLEVTGGPTKADGYTWWQLRNPDGAQEGWSAAGSGGEAFLEPTSAP